MSLKKVYVLLAFFCCQIAAAQEGIPVYWDYLQDNLYLLHPSMAGAAKASKIRLTARSQWAGVDDAPALQTMSINSRIGQKVGVGGIIYNDKNGYFSQQGAFATFAYHLRFSRNEVDLNQLSFGINAGVVQGSLDETSFGPTNDPIINGGVLSDTYFNIDFGMSYNFLDFSAHFTVKNALPAKRDIFSQDLEPNNQRRYIASLGYVITPASSNWGFEPSIMFQTTESTGESAIDGNLKTYYQTDWGSIWAGLSYRRDLDGGEFLADGETIELQKSQFYTPFIGGMYNDFLLGYTYSYQANDTVLSNGGFHQITLGYNFGSAKSRYDCSCPAIN